MLIKRFSNILGPDGRPIEGKALGRHRFLDVAYTYRMGAGFAGDVNCTHPASIEPALIDTTYYATAYGVALVASDSTQGGQSSLGAANTVRAVQSGDTGLTSIYGILVRPYPLQSTGLSNSYGADPIGGVSPPTSGAVDVLKRGYIIAPVYGTAIKGNAVNLWIAASTGGHVQGGFEAATSGGNTVTLTNCFFNGPSDLSGTAGAWGLGEVVIHN